MNNRWKTIFTEQLFQIYLIFALTLGNVFGSNLDLRRHHTLEHVGAVDSEQECDLLRVCVGKRRLFHRYINFYWLIYFVKTEIELIEKQVHSAIGGRRYLIADGVC